MKHKRIFRVFLIGLSLCALLMACSSGQQTVTSQNEPGKAPAGGEPPKPPAGGTEAGGSTPAQGGQTTQSGGAPTGGAPANPPGGHTAGPNNPEPPVVAPTGTANAVDGALKRVHFDYDKSNITPEAADILKKNRDYITANPAVKVLIEGYCDERGTIEYNLALGERRANAVRRFLEDLRVDPKRMDTISYGEERPVDPASTEEAWAKNRRAEFKEIQK